MVNNQYPENGTDGSNADPARQFSQPAPSTEKPTGVRVSWQVIIGLILLIPAVIFALINAQMVTISVIFKEFKAPLILIILGSIAIGSISTLLVSWNIRRKKAKKQRSQM
ncbi:MAG: LapA family protein [Eubacteriales bacterium]|nr:LapA family protein [Eubacteriales bacterium]